MSWRSLPPSIAFRLRGVKCNRDAIGAAVTMETHAGRQTRRLQAGSGFLSQHSKEVFFGLGPISGQVKASIEWPSGVVQQLGELPVNHRIWVEEGVAPSRMEPFKKSARWSAISKPQAGEALPVAVETWLLAPVPAPDFSLPDSSGKARTLSALRGKPVLLNLLAQASTELAGLRRLGPGLAVVTVMFGESKLSGDFPMLRGSDEVAAVYNILYRYLFDRRRDLALPTSFLVNQQGEIVKVYQGPSIRRTLQETC